MYVCMYVLLQAIAGVNPNSITSNSFSHCVQFGQLGIDFGGLNQDSSPHSTPVAPGYVPDSLLSYTDVHRLVELNVVCCSLLRSLVY